MKVSVALCTYNGHRFLLEQLSSIACQSRPPDELVICDDASIDGTVQIVREFSPSAPFPVYLEVNAQRLGVVKNFERAITRCSGDIIALCDQDDVWLSQKLQRLETTLNTNASLGLVFSDAEVVDENLNSLGYRMWEKFFPEAYRREFDHQRTLDILLLACSVTGATMAFRADLRPILLPIPALQGMHHDGWIALIASQVARIAYINEPLILYRQHPGQQLGAGKTPNGARKTPNFDPPTQWAVPIDETVSFERKKLASVYQRLIESEGRFNSRVAARKVAARLRHLETRNNLTASRWRRLPGLLRELVTMRYHRHSNGFLSFAKDLLVR